jgi:hypothetical protein
MTKYLKKNDLRKKSLFYLTVSEVPVHDYLVPLLLGAWYKYHDRSMWYSNVVHLKGTSGRE